MGITRRRGHTMPSGPRPPTADRSRRPGRVVALHGIVFQCDADDPISWLFIRPLQQLSRQLRGRGAVGPRPSVPLANHAGIRVRVACPDGRMRTYVVEQLTGTVRQHFVNGLSWTPWKAFKAREAGGWDVTVPATAFAGVEPADVPVAIDRLNHWVGHPFYGEICTAFIERVFGGRPLFQEVAVLDRLVPGPGPRIPEPAAPVLKPDAELSERARQLLHVDSLAALHGDVERAKAAERSGRPAEAMLARDDAVRRFDRSRPTLGMVWFWMTAQLGRLWARRH